MHSTHGRFGLAAVVAVFWFSACGDEVASGTPETEDTLSTVELHGKTPQGKTPQGKTPQGKTPQGQLVNVQRLDKLGSTIPNWFGTYTVNGYDQVALVGSKLRFKVPTLVFTKGSTGSTTSWVDAPVGATLTANGLVQYTNMERNVTARIVGRRTEASGTPDAGTPNMTNGAIRDNLTFYALEVSQGDGTWKPMCNTDEGNWGLFTQGYWSNDDIFDNFVEQTGAYDRYLGFSCLDGTSAKCVRWGYMPWKTNVTSPQTSITVASLMPLYKACVHAAMADYCGTLQTHTEDATVIDIWDVYGFIKKVSEWGDDPGFSNETAWNDEGALCIEKTRWESLGIACTEPTITQPPTYCDPYALGCFGWPKPITINANSVYEQGNRAACVADQARWGKSTLLYVDSSTYCSHPTTWSGPPLRKDCNFCTNAVCGTPGYESCCTTGWTSACVNKAAFACLVYAPPILSSFSAK